MTISTTPDVIRQQVGWQGMAFLCISVGLIVRVLHRTSARNAMCKLKGVCSAFCADHSQPIQHDNDYSRDQFFVKLCMTIASLGDDHGKSTLFSPSSFTLVIRALVASLLSASVASMVALSANRLACSAMAVITSPTWFDESAS